MLGRMMLVAALAAPTLASAADAAVCDDPQGRQQVMNACMAKKLDEADAGLNRTYAVLNGKLDDSGKRNLVAAERAWIAFRDRECELRSGTDTQHPENNGTITPFLVGQCRLDLTNRRNADLQAELKCPGGDLPCSP